MPEDVRSSLIGGKTTPRTPLKMKPSMQSTGDVAKSDQGDTDSKEQPPPQDVNGVSMMTLCGAPYILCAACQGQNKYPEGCGETQEAGRP